MIIDKLTEFCDGTSAILAVGNAVIGNVVPRTNALNALKDIGTGEPVYLVLQVTTTFVGATATVAFDLRSDTTAATATSPVTHYTTGALAVGTWVEGYTKVIALPLEKTYKDYLKIWETVATANITDGAINAFLTHDVSRWRAYADNA